MTKQDRAALKLALEYASREGTRARQLKSKLLDETWAEVAAFASYCCQKDSLKLKPWQVPPCWIDDPNNPDDGCMNTADTKDGRFEAARLLKRMLAAGVSKFHPDPMSALDEHAVH